MTRQKLACALIISLSGCSAATPPQTETAALNFSGRFIDVWGIKNIAELSSSRVRDGSQISTEVLVPRLPGQVVDNGSDVAAVSFKIEIECHPVSYDLVYQTNYSAEGAILSSRPTVGAEFSPRGPYSDLADELCAANEPAQIDFTSLAQFRQQAASRLGGAITAASPSIVRSGE